MSLGIDDCRISLSSSESKCRMSLSPFGVESWQCIAKQHMSMWSDICIMSLFSKQRYILWHFLTLIPIVCPIASSGVDHLILHSQDSVIHIYLVACLHYYSRLCHIKSVYEINHPSNHLDLQIILLCTSLEKYLT